MLAGIGSGKASATIIEALYSAAKQGIVVIRSTRISNSVYVGRNFQIDDDHYGFVASGALDAPRSRILTQLLLATSTYDPRRVQAAFDERGRQ